MADQTLSDGSRPTYTGLSPDYRRQREHEETRLALSLLGAALQKDMSGDLRDTLTRARDAMLTAKFAREDRP